MNIVIVDSVKDSTNKLNISVDVGRSSIKTRVTSKLSKPVDYVTNIPSVVATNKNSFAKGSNSVAQYSTEKDLHSCTLESEDSSYPLKGAYLFGDTATLRGDGVHDFSEGEEFHKISSAVVVYSVARAIEKYHSLNPSAKPGLLGKVNHKMNLTVAINLTFENEGFTDTYANYLKRQHSVTLELMHSVTGVPYETKVVFEIKELYCFYQGYVAVFNLGLGKGANPVVTSSPGLAIDIGRRTLDMTYIDAGFSIVSGESVPFGTHSMLKELQKLVRREGVSITLSNLENKLINKEACKTLSSKDIVPHKIMSEAKLVEKLFADIHRNMFDFISDRPVSYIVIAGGGYFVMKKAFQAEFGDLILELDSPVYANVNGMDKFIQNIIHGGDQ